MSHDNTDSHIIYVMFIFRLSLRKTNILLPQKLNTVNTRYQTLQRQHAKAKMATAENREREDMWQPVLRDVWG